MDRPPLHRRKGSDGHFPAILPSTLWTNDDIALLGNLPSTRTQSRTDKQAAKIADYLQLYGGTLPPSRAMTAKSSAPTVKIEELPPMLAHTSQTHSNSVGLLSPTPNFSVKSSLSTSRELEKLKKEAEDLSYTVYKARSDKLELMRDLATYEHNFSTEYKLSERLLSLRGYASKLPSIFASLSQTLDYEREAYREVKDGLTIIGVLSKETDSGPDSASIPVTAFDIRPLSDAFINRELYRGAANISNIHCLVSVSGDGLFRNMKITAQTLSGSLFRMIIHQDLLEQQNLTTSEQVRKAVRFLILPHLYFQSFGNEMKLLFDPDCNVSFLTLIVDVKGSDEPLVTVRLSESGDEISLELTISKEQLTVPRKDVTQQESVFLEPLKTLAREVEKHLLWNGDSVVWLQSTSQDLIFKSREKKSPFLDDDYISDVFQILTFAVVSTERYQYENIVLRVEVLAHKELTRLRLVSDDRTLELDPSSRELSFALGLQSMPLRISRTTLLKSLEFRVLVRKLFPPKL